jgi:hypothetical protein
VQDRLVVPGFMAVVAELYAPQVHMGRDPGLGHYPRIRVPRFYVQLSKDDLDALLVPLAI